MTSVFARLIAAAGLCVATVAGCSSAPAGEEPTMTTSAQDPEAELHARPPFEAAAQQYLAAVTEMADRIVALMPGLTWELRENSWRGCGGEFVDTHGVQAYVYAVFSGPTPEPVWPQALQVVTDAAARLGATDMRPVADKPGNRDVVFGSADGVEIEFGTAAGTILSAKSDCRLRQQNP
jgi:hypothetical protein